MAEMNDIVKLAVDSYKGKVEGYSVDQTQETLRKALVEANGGSTKLNYKAVRDGQCKGLFSLVETILSKTVVDGLVGDEFFNALVEFRNIAEGDQNIFIVEDSDLYVVDEVADGTQAVRRQRIGGATEYPITTSMKVIKIYEELNRVLSGRIDFNKLIDKVAASFKQKMLNDIYTLWSGATATDFGGQTYFVTGGTYSESALLDLIQHVEAAAGGKPATLVGTKKALYPLMASIRGSEGNNTIDNQGYVGKFYGSAVVAMPQRHQVGTTTFIFDDKTINVIAGDDKPIKFVYEGDPLVIMGDPKLNQDLTQEYFYGEKYGLGIVLAGGNSGIGRYEYTGVQG